MSNSTPVTMADRKVSTNRLNRPRILFSYQHKASRGANAPQSHFHQGEKSTVLFLHLFGYFRNVSGMFVEVGGALWVWGSFYLQSLVWPSGPHEELSLLWAAEPTVWFGLISFWYALAGLSVCLCWLSLSSRSETRMTSHAQQKNHCVLMSNMTERLFISPESLHCQRCNMSHVTNVHWRQTPCNK